MIFYYREFLLENNFVNILIFIIIVKLVKLKVFFLRFYKWIYSCFSFFYEVKNYLFLFFVFGFVYDFVLVKLIMCMKFFISFFSLYSGVNLCDFIGMWWFKEFFLNVRLILKRMYWKF